MLFFVALACLVPAFPIDASLDVLRVLHQNNKVSDTHQRARRDSPDIDRQILRSLPYSYSLQQRFQDDSRGLNRVPSEVYGRERLLGANNGQREEYLDNIVLDLLSQLRKYRDDEPSINKRVWGRNNIQPRFASFGTKLAPNRKTLLGNGGSTLLRYGRSVDI